MRTYWKNIFEEFFLISFFYQRKINNMELIAEQYELRTKSKLLFSVFYCKQTSKQKIPLFDRAAKSTRRTTPPPGWIPGDTS